MTTEARVLAASVPEEAGRPVPGQRLPRFNGTERAVHWVQATTFIVLLLTGFALQLPSIEGLIGNRELLREIHLSTAFFFFFGPALIGLSADRAALARDVHEVDTWSVDDLRWLIPFPILRLFGISTPPQGRFNAGQKLNAIFVVWSTLAFTVTGLIIWQNRRFDTTLVSHANTIHQTVAYLALAAFLGHVFLATAYPSTRHAFRSITQGWVRRDWAEAHHPKWARTVVVPAGRSGSGGWSWLGTGLEIVLGGFACLFAVRVYFFQIGANVTDKVTERLYDITAWPGAAVIHPQTAVRLTDWIGMLYLLGCVVAWAVVDRLRRRGSTPAS